MLKCQKVSNIRDMDVLQSSVANQEFLNYYD